ncbi:MAG: asparagine synthase (glutamine-hydrolyzing) [Deltaproteobacteria bacterium]|nr:asparagine synthase (glutamine-hydrolyzing) [Deltaproteobacteria bacterium]
MCGICGIINSTLPESENIEIVERMCYSMVHRGPDYGGYKSFGSHCLGMRRLSIIDTSPKGNQPMSNEDETIWIVCNGEIYNFRENREWLEKKGHYLRSNTDVEVILHLYEEFGKDLLPHLRGMFTFALWDVRKSEFFLARDRLGIKPIYYVELNGKLLFASELRALVSSRVVQPEIDLQSLDLYLSFGYVPQPKTLLKKVQYLLPGHALHMKGNRITIWKYWDFPKPGSNEIPVSEIIPRTRQLLEEDIAIHQISDVPIGAFLSGGIDSTAVVGLMSALTNAPVRTFSVGFDEVPSRFNELHIARITAQRFGTKHTEVIVSGQDVSDQIDDIVGHIDHPSFDGINSYFISKAAKSGGVTVSLSGLGGDELFGGYGSFNVIPRWSKAIRLWGLVPLSLRDALTKMVSKRTIPGLDKRRRRKIGCMARVDSVIGLYCLARLLLWPQEKMQLYSPEMLHFLNTNNENQKIVELLEKYVRSDLDPWQLVSQLEMRTYMAWRLLRDTDVMSMAHSLEVRVPFIDHKLVEFICRLPRGWEKRWGFSKKILVESLGDLLPKEVINQPKHGFELPMEQWMRNELKPLVEDTLSEQSIVKRGFFRFKSIFDVYEGFQKGEYSYPVIWQFVVLELWIRSIFEGSL